QAEWVGQETAVIAALSRNGCTGSGVAHPSCPAGWTGVLSGAGDVLCAGAPVLAAGGRAGPGDRRAQRGGPPRGGTARRGGATAPKVPPAPRTATSRTIAITRTRRDRAGRGSASDPGSPATGGPSS